MKTLWRYVVPITFSTVGILTLVRPSDRPVLTIVPIVPGEYQLELALLFFLIALFTAYALYKSDPSRKNRD